MASKDLNSVKAEITIGGEPCDFSTLTLRQTMSSHHWFTIVLNYRAKEKDVWARTCSDIFKKLKGKVSITITDNQGVKSTFEGVVRKVDIRGKYSDQGEVVLTGGSPTLLMTDDYHMDSFCNMDVGDIVHEVISKLELEMGAKIDPKLTEDLPFVYRYKESSYGFLRRLAVSCGESLYYDGKQLVVGFPEATGEDIRLTFKDDLLTMSICAAISNYDREQYDYDYTQDRICQQISPPNGGTLDKYSDLAFRKSQGVYKDYMVQPSAMPIRSNSSGLMIHAVQNEHSGKLGDGSYLKATTSTCKIKLNSVIFVETDSKLDRHTREMDRFRVIEITHDFDDNKKSYRNEIIAVNADTEYFPIRDYVQPVAMPEVATVVDNADPKNLGRVKVKFMWQKLDDHPQHKTSDWIRVQTPDAGSSGAVEKNRGFFFVPEIDDQVMVGFELGDPNRPFVMGSLFYKENAGGVAENNKLKSITTRSGSTLTIDDDAHTILLCTSKANQIFIDEQNGVIAITSAEEVNVTTKNVNIDASENMTVTVGKDFNMLVEGDSNVTLKGNLIASMDKDSTTTISGTSECSIGGEHNLTVAKKLSIKTDADANIETGGQMTIASAKNMYVKSKAKVDIAKG